MHDINKTTLLEYTLNQMKNETIKYTRSSRRTQEASEGLLKEELQQLISEPTTEDTNTAINNKQDEISQLEEIKLFDILSKKRNYMLLEDERPTSAFLKLESSKAG